MESSKKGARTGGPNPGQKHILVSLAALPGLCADSLPPIAPQKFFPFPCRRSAPGGLYRDGSPYVPQCRRYAAAGGIVQGRQPLPFPCRRYAAPGGIVQGRQPLPFPCRRSAPAGGIVQGRQPLRTPNAGAMPPSGRLYRGGSPYLSLAGAPPCTRVTFSPMRKSPKNLPEGSPSGYSPLGGRSRSPCGTAATPSKWCLRSPSFWGERR